MCLSGISFARPSSRDEQDSGQLNGGVGNNIRNQGGDKVARKQKQEAKLKYDAQKFLTLVPEEYVFRCHDGRILKNMKELREALAVMADETFAYHSNSEKKDFSNWVRDVIGDEKLAKDLENALDRNQAARIVTSRIDILIKALA